MKIGRKNLWLVGVIALLLVYFGWQSYPLKGQANLAWNANAEADLAGYKIYYGTEPRTGDCPPGGYGEKADAGRNNNYQLKNLEIGKVYYFSVTSYNASGRESCFSGEIKKTVGHPAWERLKKFFER